MGEEITAEVKIEIPYYIENLLDLKKQKDCKITVSSDFLIIVVKGGGEFLRVRVPAKSVLEALRLELPPWARVEKVVERKVEVLPKVEVCKKCGKKLSDVDEVFAWVKDRKIIGAFCSEKCMKGTEKSVGKMLKEGEG